MRMLYRILIQHWYERRMIRSLWETMLYIAKHSLVIHQLCTYVFIQFQWKSVFTRKTLIWGFVTALFIHILDWKKPKCTLRGDSIHKQWYSYEVKWNTVIKTEQLPGHGNTWRNHESILWSGRGPSEVLRALQFKLYSIWKRSNYRQ